MVLQGLIADFDAAESSERIAAHILLLLNFLLLDVPTHDVT
jgi:hypothetical protein